MTIKTYKRICILITFLLSVSLVFAKDHARTYIKGVPVICQFPELPTGCEATALTMLLNYYGYDKTKLEVSREMPKVPIRYKKNGKSYGGHPNDGFIGSPFSKAAYGVYVKPIEKMINQYTTQQAYNLTGAALEDLFKVLDKGQPVMIWASINMGRVYPTQTWDTENYGKFTWLANEHAVVMVGYDDQYIWINDPWDGKQKKYKISAVKTAYNRLGRQAITIKPPHMQYQVVTSVLNGIPYTMLKYENAQYIKLREAMDQWGWQAAQEDQMLKLYLGEYKMAVDLKTQYPPEEMVELFDYRLINGTLYIHTDTYKSVLAYNQSLLNLEQPEQDQLPEDAQVESLPLTED